jgi:hypothetical protein
MYYEQVLLNRFSPEIQLCSARQARSSRTLPPHPPPPGPCMTRVRDFVADLARAGKSFTEIKKNIGSCLLGPELEFFVNI